MSTEFVSAGFTADQLNTVVKKLGGENNTRALLRGGLAADCAKLAQHVGPDGKVTLESFMKCVTLWTERDGVIYLTVTSDGTTGPQWIGRLEVKGSRLSKWAKDILHSKDFTPTSGVTYNVAVLKGMLFSDDERITSNIRAEATNPRRNLEKPNAEIACLIRDNFLDADIEAMGLLRVIAMHDPIEDSDGFPCLLAAVRIAGGRGLDAYDGRSVNRWYRGDGFAFVASQVSSRG